ncbi:MAG: VWA domain-containing protein [Desulfomonilaceae bacterium]
MARLSVLLSRSLITVSESSVEYRIDQTFFNDNDYPLDGLFILPIGCGDPSIKPDVRVDGAPCPFSLFTPEHFFPTLRDLTVSMKDPSLLGLAGESVMVIQPIHIGVRQQKSFRILFKKPLALKNEDLEILLPLIGERYSRGPVGELDIRARLKMSRPVRAVFSPSHHLTIVREAPHRCMVIAKAKEKKVRHDFRLLVTFSGEDLDLRVFNNRSPGRKGAFMALVSPPIAYSKGREPDKDVVFLLDASGSMGKPDLELAKKAVLFGLEKLRSTDRFNVLTVGTCTGRLTDTLVSASSENLMKAARFVNSTRGGGGSDMYNGLMNALEQFTSRKLAGIVVFVGDGRASVGVTNREVINGDVRRKNKTRARIFVLSIGDADVAMLDKVAMSNRGTSFRLADNDDFPSAMNHFFAGISPPQASDLSLEFHNISVEDVEPKGIPDLFGQDSIGVFGRYDQAGDPSANVVLRAKVQGRLNTVVQNLRFSAVDASHSYIPRLWAMRRVARLLEKESLKGSESERRDQIAVLAKEYGFRLPKTATLATQHVSPSDKDTGGLLWNYKMSSVAADVESEQFRSVEGKVFRSDNGVWVDTEYRPSMAARTVKFLSKEYFSLCRDNPSLGHYLALGPDIIFVSDKGPIRIASDTGTFR